MLKLAISQGCLLVGLILLTVLVISQQNRLDKQLSLGLSTARVTISNAGEIKALRAATQPTTQPTTQKR